MTIPLRTLDELQSAPHMATLPALSATIAAFSAALQISHPDVGATEQPRPRDAVAWLLCMYLDACQQLLREYDQLTFDAYEWSDNSGETHGHAEPDDDLPF